jgi:hypothetical protein
VAGSQSALRLLLSVVSAPATAAIRGGSAEIVTDTSGCVIRSAGLDEAGVIGRLADAIETHARDAARDEHLSAVALARAGDLDWCSEMARIQPFALARVDSGAHEKLPAARAEYA